MFSHADRFVAVVLLFLILSQEAWCQSADKEDLGTLVLCGGGKPYNADVLDAFWKSAGGKQAKIVVIPTAHPEMDQPETIHSRLSLLTEPWQARGVASLEVLHAKNRELANDNSIVRPLTEATGVWIGGGDQRRLRDIYFNTSVHRELHELYRRGGVIGGSSAGTAIQSELMILGGSANKTDLATGFGFLPDTIVDQHFLTRNRMQRLQQSVVTHPEVSLGIGIDEYTAAVIHAGTLTVVGRSSVSILRKKASLNLIQVESLVAGNRRRL